jgi:hypothetical protein
MVLPSVLMIDLLILAVHLLATVAKLVRPGGVRAVVAEVKPLMDKRDD